MGTQGHYDLNQCLSMESKQKNMKQVALRRAIIRRWESDAGQVGHSGPQHWISKWEAGMNFIISKKLWRVMG